MKRISIYKRILSLTVCLAIILTGSVTAIALDNSRELDESNYSEGFVPDGADTHDHSEDELPQKICTYCGAWMVINCNNSNQLRESYTHTYGPSKERCTIEVYTSKYYSTCPMGLVLGCPYYIFIDLDEHLCYYKHWSCGIGIDDWCGLIYEP